ncbi:hypothetical protein PG997_001747 [Apiospora hydei]|uniref:Knr4/Smi1-like domain-containing protein n=1 Tax=Apiospora hydei TaxID=1337664 RepID=A0ABR1XEK1_9PEZI
MQTHHHKFRVRMPFAQLEFPRVNILVLQGFASYSRATCLHLSTSPFRRDLRAAASDEHEVNRGETEEAYSHDATVAAITSMWKYVSELYGSDYYPLSYPTPGGWEGFNRDNFKILQEKGKYNNGLTDRVLNLMKHIPYFTLSDPELMWLTHPAYHNEYFCNPDLRPPETDREKQRAQERKVVTRDNYEDHLPPHFMVLTVGETWRCWTIIIDTELGAVRFWDRYGGHEYPTEVPADLGYEEDADDYDEDGPEGWKLAPIYRISTFFDLWRKEFLVSYDIEQHRIAFLPPRSMVPVSKIADPSQNWNKELLYRSDEEEEEEEESENEDKDEQEAHGETFDDDRAKL